MMGLYLYESQERAKEVLAWSSKFEFLRKGKAIIVSGHYAARQDTNEVVT